MNKKLNYILFLIMMILCRENIELTTKNTGTGEKYIQGGGA